MNSRFVAAASILSATFVMSSASAHHSFAAVFDGSRSIDVEGVVREFQMINPHAEMTLEVTDGAGNKELRSVEFDGRLNLIVGGWTDDTIEVGERVTIHGNPARSGNRIWFLKLTRADGSELVRPVLDRLNAIDEQRRASRQQREEQN